MVIQLWHGGEALPICLKLYVQECGRKARRSLDDILFRLDNIISLNRMVQENPYIYVAGKKYDECARRQLSLYSLWRSSQAAEQGTMRDAEDCFLMARVIDDTITEEPIWAELQDFFAREQHAESEKYRCPLGA